MVWVAMVEMVSNVSYRVSAHLHLPEPPMVLTTGVVAGVVHVLVARPGEMVGWVVVVRVVTAEPEPPIPTLVPMALVAGPH